MKLIWHIQRGWGELQMSVLQGGGMDTNQILLIQTDQPTKIEQSHLLQLNILMFFFVVVQGSDLLSGKHSYIFWSNFSTIFSVPF